LPPVVRAAVGGARAAMRRRQMAEGALLGLRVGLVIALALTAASWLAPLLDRQQQAAWAALTVAGVTLLGLMVGLLQPVSPMTSARALDARLGLRERVGTALDLANRDPHGRFTGDQAADAAGALAGRAWRPAFRARPGRTPLLTALALGALLAGALALPNPQQASLDERAAARQALVAGAQRITAARERAAARRDLDAALQAALVEPLRALERALREENPDRRQAMARVAAAEEALRRQVDPSLQRRAEGLDHLGQELLTSSYTTTAGRALRQGDPAGAGKELANLAGRLDRLDAGEQQALGSKLERAAATQAVGNPELAASLGNAAAALQAGDAAGAGRQLGEAAQRLRDLGADQAAQAERGRLLDELAQARQQIGGNGGQSPSAAPSGRATPVSVARGGAGGQQGQGAGQQRAGGSGQSSAGSQTGAGGAGQSRAGQGQGQGNGSAGAGQGRLGATSPRTDGGTAGAAQPIFDRPGQPATGEYEAVYAPRFAESTGEISEVGGRDAGQGPSESQPVVGEGGRSAPRVPYQQVYPQYRQQATEALERGAVPPHLRDYVRDYFTSLDAPSP
jgi:hypothetical protein